MVSIGISKIKKIITAIAIKKYFLALVFGLGLFNLFNPRPADAASLYYSPTQGSYEIGKSFTINVYTACADQALNAFSGTISFPTDILQITSISKSGSIANLWVQEPSFSNVNGTVNFSGLVLNPGFKGASGKILSINFKTKATGAANLRFSAGEILANDGKGTNILQDFGAAQIKVITAAVGPQAPESTSAGNKAGTPLAPIISSLTHPDPNAWYNKSNPKFTWEVPKDVTAVRVLYDKYPVSDPTVVYQPPINGKDLSEVSDGVYYFHVQFRNAQGWGAISHFRFQIDTVSPLALSIRFPHRDNSSDPRPVVLFDTTDELSGIDYYEVKVGDGQAFKVTPGEIVASNPYVLPTQKPGQHTIIVKAVDKAGNSAAASEIFNVAALDVPVLDYYSNDLIEGDILKVSGKTYPWASVMIFIRDESGSVFNDKITSNAQGNFTLIWSKKLSVGTYSLWAQATDVDGAKSAITTPSTFVVRQPLLDKMTNLILNYLSAFILLAFFILGLIFFAWYGWHKFLVLRKKIKKEVRGVEKDFLHIFDYLQQDIEQQIQLLEKAKNKRELTKEEKRIITILRRDLAAAQKVLSEEMEGIADEVE